MVRNINTTSKAFVSRNVRQLQDANLLKEDQRPQNGMLSKKGFPLEKYISLAKILLIQKIINLCQILVKKPRVHSVIAMNSAGFHYIDGKDTARCDMCGIEVSEWTLNMCPFTIHAQQSPQCPFVHSILSDLNKYTTPSINHFLNISALADVENPPKRPKLDVKQITYQPLLLAETKKMKEARKRTFSHWPHRTSSSSEQMIQAGFFNCNVGDRVICLYCNIICQQWVPHVDDPCEAHKILSPKCPYVRSMLIHQTATHVVIINDLTNDDQTSASTDTETYRFHELVYTAACHSNYIEIPKRHDSFALWPNENLPPIEDLVRAGFFFTGNKTIVTCFYCNGSLQNWGPNDNPMIEHARWFPHCAYAKQLCGDELYSKIQQSKRLQQERTDANESNKELGTIRINSITRSLIIPDDSTLSRFVASRLDLWISQYLLGRNFKLTIIKRCYEDQLRIKQADFLDDCDVFLACKILQKQIDYINGKKENILVPNLAIKKILESKQPTMHDVEESVSSSSTLISNSNNTDVEMRASSELIRDHNYRAPSKAIDQQTKTLESSTKKGSDSNRIDSPFSGSLCVMCLTEERRIACIPCGHLCACVPCGHSIRHCPMCRREIEAFVRIYT